MSAMLTPDSTAAIKSACVGTVGKTVGLAVEVGEGEFDRIVVEFAGVGKGFT
jgi:hypothetical protein